MSTTAERPASTGGTESDRTVDGQQTPPQPPRRKRGRKPKDDSADQAGPVWTFLAWLLTLIFFAPVAWMVLTSLHDESDAATNPPSIFAPITFGNYGAVFERGISSFLINSATASIVSTLLVLALAVPAAYALAIKPV